MDDNIGTKKKLTGCFPLGTRSLLFRWLFIEAGLRCRLLLPGTLRLGLGLGFLGSGRGQGADHVLSEALVAALLAGLATTDEHVIFKEIATTVASWIDLYS